MKQRSSRGLRYLSGAAFLCMLALAGLVGTAGASAATQHWYRLNTEGRLSEHTPTEVTASGEGLTRFAFNNGGIRLEISCTAMGGSGTIENPSGGANGKLRGAVLTFSGCSVVEPAGCTVPTTIATNALQGEATLYEGRPATRFEPESGTTLFTFTVGGTQCAGIIKGSRSLTGSFLAEAAESPAGRYSVTQASSAGLKYAGVSVQMIGSYGLASRSSAKPVTVETDRSPAGQHWYIGPRSETRVGLAAGSPFNYSSASDPISLNVAATVGGVKTRIECGGSSSRMEGTVENPLSGGAGTATGRILPAGCSIPEPNSGACIVEGVESELLSGLATEAAGAPAVTFAREGSFLDTFLVGGASCPAALKGSKKLTGKLTAVPDAFGTFVFSSSLSALKYGGQNATVSGQAALTMGGGEPLLLAP
jgi:hypothetical protein